MASSRTAAGNEHARPIFIKYSPDKELGKAIPYGVYDIAKNEGWVNIGINHDTARFAANSVKRWWTEMGQHRFPHATRLFRIV